jgi:site-specific DNA recombinase
MSEPRRFAFYGRVSTDDMQDPVASRAWQLDVAKKLIAGFGEIELEYFDISESRSIPWSRRPEASALLTEMRSVSPRFDAVVIGEPHRAFSGNQFGNTFPLFVELGVQLWIPEKSGPLDPGSDADELMMTVYGGLSKGERQRTRIRVRNAMTSMASSGSRFLGGRPPYGYELVDAGPHPNPSKAADGKRLKRLEIDLVAAPHVREIFNLRLEGTGYYAIAKHLNERAVPSPSAHDPARNPHRRQGPWSHSTVRTILENPRYTGFEVWGKAPKQEKLIDLDDVAAGHKTIQKVVDPDRWVRSEEPAHPAIIDVETFERVQTITGSQASRRPRKPRASHLTFLLSGLVFCADCGSRMEADKRNGKTRYRCRHLRRYPGAEHCETIDVWEDALIPQLDTWLAEVFQPDEIEGNIERILASLEEPDEAHATAVAALREEERKALVQVENLRMAIADGADASAIIPGLNAAHGRAKAARNRLDGIAKPAPQVTKAQLLAALGGTLDFSSILDGASSEERAALYKSYGVTLSIDHTSREAKTTADLGKQVVGLNRVGGGT